MHPDSLEGLTFEEIIGQLRHVQGGLPIERLTSRIVTGVHRSIFKGPSYDFIGIRPYEPERDPPNQIILFSPVFSLDEDEIFARENIEQKEIRVITMCRLSSSIDIRISTPNKIKTLLCSLGCLGLTATRDRNPNGLIGFTDQIIINESPAYGQDNVFYLVRLLYDFIAHANKTKKPKRWLKRKVDFYRAFDFLIRCYDRPCFVPVITDFAGLPEMIDLEFLRHVTSLHEVIFLIIYDPSEFQVKGKFGTVFVSDIESEESGLVPIGSFTAMQKKTEEDIAVFMDRLRRAGVESALITADNYLKELSNFFEIRNEQSR